MEPNAVVRTTEIDTGGDPFRIVDSGFTEPHAALEYYTICPNTVYFLCAFSSIYPPRNVSEIKGKITHGIKATKGHTSSANVKKIQYL